MPGALSPAQRAHAAAAWPLRAAEELRSALVYRALARACEAALPAFASRFAAVAHEEVGHARLCADVGRRLGAARPCYDAAPVRRRLATLADPAARTGALILGEVAIGETISVAMFRESRRATTEPVSRAAIHQILRDEARHAQLGWEALAALPPSTALQREASVALAAAEAQIAAPALAFLARGELFDPAWAELGVVPPERRVAAFYDVIERVVVPRLDRAGLDGARAWAERYRVAIPMGTLA